MADAAAKARSHSGGRGKAALGGVMEPSADRLAGIYAEALLATVLDDAEGESACAELEELAERLASIDGVADLLIGAVFNAQQRVEMVQRVFGGRVGEHVEAMLVVAARHGRMSLLGGVAKRFRAMLNIRERKVEVFATTAVAMDDEVRSQLIRMLPDIIDGDPILSENVDPSIMGGVLLRTGDRVFDASLASDLQRMGQTLTQAPAGVAGRRAKETEGKNADDEKG